MSTGGALGDAEREQIIRVEGLLGTVRDMVSSLSRASGQLEFEIKHALRRDPEDLTGGLAQRLLALMTENAQLREALDSRAVIEQAKGMIMMSRRCDAAQAFELLTALSRHQRRKVRDVALALVQEANESGQLPVTDIQRPKAVPRTAGPRSAGPHTEAPRSIGRPAV